MGESYLCISADKFNIFVNYLLSPIKTDFGTSCLFSTFSICSWPWRTRFTASPSSSLSMRSWRHSRPWWETRVSESWWRRWTQSSSGNSRSSSKASESRRHPSLPYTRVFCLMLLSPPIFKDVVERLTILPTCGSKPSQPLYLCYALSIFRPSLVDCPQLTPRLSFSTIWIPLHPFFYQDGVYVST